MKHPLMIRTGPLTGRIYGIRRYTVRADQTVISRDKEDVTDQAVDAVIEHIRHGCGSVGCRCNWLREVHA